MRNRNMLSRWLRYGLFWGLLVPAAVVWILLSTLNEAELIIINDAHTPMQFSITVYGTDSTYQRTIRPGQSAALYLPRDQLPKGKLAVCTDADRCQYVVYQCRGFGGCSGAELSKTVRYSALKKSHGPS